MEQGPPVQVGYERHKILGSTIGFVWFTAGGSGNRRRSFVPRQPGENTLSLDTKYNASEACCAGASPAEKSRCNEDTPSTLSRPSPRRRRSDRAYQSSWSSSTSNIAGFLSGSFRKHMRRVKPMSLPTRFLEHTVPPRLTSSCRADTKQIRRFFCRLFTCSKFVF